MKVSYSNHISRLLIRLEERLGSKVFCGKNMTGFSCKAFVGPIVLVSYEKGRVKYEKMYSLLTLSSNRTRFALH